MELRMNSTDRIKNYCEYLTFRSFYTGFPVARQNVSRVDGVDGAIHKIKEVIATLDNPALLLSGGMDSAVLLPFMPKDSTAYTIYHERLETNEVEIAKNYCHKFSIKHVAISIDPYESLSIIDELMINKKMPLSPAEPMLYLAAKQANLDGFKEVVSGGGVDTKFGGFTCFRRDHFSAKYQEKLQRRYLQPKNILQEICRLDHVFDQYLMPAPKDKIMPDKIPMRRFLRSISPRKRDRCIVDYNRFLRELGVERFAFDNAIALAGCEHVAPFNQFAFDFDEKLNLERPKYFIQNLYREIYNQEAPEKLGLQKPTYMLTDYSPSNFQLFRSDIDMSALKYPQIFLIYCLERFEALRLKGLV
jgi:hypothetical protein